MIGNKDEKGNYSKQTLKAMADDGTMKKISETYFQTDVSVEPKEKVTESVSAE